MKYANGTEPRKRKSDSIAFQKKRKRERKEGRGRVGSKVSYHYVRGKNNV